MSLSSLAAFNGFIARYVDHQHLGDVGPLFAVYSALILAIRIAGGAGLADGYGATRTATAAISCIVTGMAVIAAWHSLPGLYVGVVIFAVGQLIPGAHPPRHRPDAGQRAPAAIATFSIFFDLSQGIGLFVLGGVVAVSGGEVWAFAAAAVLSASALLVLRRS